MATIFASADRAPATYTQEFGIGRATGVLLSINYTAEGGASSVLDFKLQYRDATEGAWDDLPGASIAQMTGIAETDLMVYPGIAAVANRQVSIAVPKALRAVAVVGVTNVTFSVDLTLLD